MDANAEGEHDTLDGLLKEQSEHGDIRYKTSVCDQVRALAKACLQYRDLAASAIGDLDAFPCFKELCKKELKELDDELLRALKGAL